MKRNIFTSNKESMDLILSGFDRSDVSQILTPCHVDDSYDWLKSAEKTVERLNKRLIAAGGMGTLKIHSTPYSAVAVVTTELMTTQTMEGFTETYSKSHSFGALFMGSEVKVGSLVLPKDNKSFRSDASYSMTPKMKVFVMTGEAKAANGWNFVSKLQRLDGGNVYVAVEGDLEKTNALPATRRCVCEHCKKPRARVDMFHIHNEDGRDMIVGKNCLNELGAQASDTLSDAFRAMKDVFIDLSMGDDSDDFGGSGGCRAPNGAVSVEVLCAKIVARLENRIKCGASKEFLEAFNVSSKEWIEVLKSPVAADMGTHAMNLLGRGHKLHVKYPSDMFAALRMVSNLDGIQHGYIPARNAEWFVQSIGSVSVEQSKKFMNAADNGCMDVEADLENMVDAAYPAHVTGAKFDGIEVEVEDSFTFSGSFGPSTIITFRTSDGYRLKTFYSGSTSFPESKFILKGTFKHAEKDRDGKWSTFVTRCKVGK